MTRHQPTFYDVVPSLTYLLIPYIPKPSDILYIDRCSRIVFDFLTESSDINLSLIHIYYKLPSTWHYVSAVLLIYDFCNTPIPLEVLHSLFPAPQLDVYKRQGTKASFQSLFDPKISSGNFTVAFFFYCRTTGPSLCR